MKKIVRPLKIYHKANENVVGGSGCEVKNIGANSMPLPELVKTFRSFYKESYRSLFDMLVKQIWLEQKLTFNGARRAKRCGNGHGIEMGYAYFMMGVVGISQKFHTHNRLLSYISLYFDEFFPNFSDHNPFEEPEYFEYPYEHVTIDFLYVVREHHDRIAMLDYAEEKKMTIQSFIDWSVNQALCYNIEKGEEFYRVIRGKNFFIYIKNMKKDYGGQKIKT